MTKRLVFTGLMSVILAGPAFGGFPHNVTGTWTLIANRAQDTLVISSQAETGRCRTIVGSIVTDVGPDALTGFYCPSTGRIFFIRLSSGTPSQVYEGHLAEGGPVNRIGGTFANMARPAEFGWSAFK